MFCSLKSRSPRRQPILRVAAAALALAALPTAAQTHRQDLTAAVWRFRAVAAPDHPEAAQWHAAVVPGVVQSDLLRAGLIPDPFVGDNEKLVQWIGATDWEYTANFNVDAATRSREHTSLIFAGLDTFAEVSLNGEPLLKADNMFRSWQVDVTGRLRAENTLRILFRSPINTVAAVAAELPYIIPGTGYETLDRSKGIYPTSQYVRKAGYSFGWDWGPRLVTSGVWKPVSLVSWNGLRLTAVHARQDSVTAERAITEVSVDAEATRGGPAQLSLQLTAPDGHQLPSARMPVTLDAGANHFSVPLRVVKPERWYPNGYGAQSLYTVRVTVTLPSGVSDSASLRTGLRSLELRRQDDAWGKSFAFVVNGIPVFAKGADFVPLDSFPPQVTPERRLKVLTAARDANMNMVRIWGGGYYEPDDFYEDADRLGLMVWQDFMFGGSMIPHDLHYMNNVQAEANEQVERLSDHPSLVLWCGNNEVETGWNDWGDRQAFKATLTAEQREQVWQDYLIVFRDILKAAVAAHGNGVPYWPSSPGADFEDTAGSLRNGDVHSWKVWSAGAPITEYAKTIPRFLSEFGFQAMPPLETVRSFAGNNEDLTSPALLNHERFVHGFDRMQQYLSAEFRPPRDFADFIYLSQLMQAEAIKFGVETMRSRRPQNMGALYWQLDDCWPVASWSSLDYYGRPKALQFYARRFYAPLLIAAALDGNHVQLRVVSDEQTGHEATLRWQLLRFDGTILQQHAEALQVVPLSSTPAPGIDTGSIAGFDPHHDVLALTLEDSQGQPLASQTLYFAPERDLELPKADIEARFQGTADGKGYLLTLRSPVLARAVQLSFDGPAVELSDNFFDLLPGRAHSVKIAAGSLTAAQLRQAMTIRSVESATK